MDAVACPFISEALIVISIGNIEEDDKANIETLQKEMVDSSVQSNSKDVEGQLCNKSGFKEKGAR